MASKRRLRRKGCTGKIKHVDSNAGFSHLRRLVKSGATGRLHVYACHFCSFFHVGHFSRSASS